MVRGNHEQMMIDAVLHGKGRHWAAEYGDWSRRFSHQELSHWAERLNTLPISITLSTDWGEIGICHAEPDGLNWGLCRENPDSHEAMMWGRRVLRNKPGENVNDVAITIHGHTPLELPQWVGNRYFMDTGAWYSGELTVRPVIDILKEYKMLDKALN